MRKALLIVAMLLLVTPVMATTTITAVKESQTRTPDGNEFATIAIRYSGVAPTDANVRAFALDVNIDSNNGSPNFQRIRDFNVGEANGAITNGKSGYGIFPSRFRDFIVVTAPNFGDSNYNPTTAWDEPETTDHNSGMGYPKMIVEMGTLYAGDANRPAMSGTLFRFDVNNYGQLGTFNITIKANALRGGVVDNAGAAITPTLVGTSITFTANECFPSGNSRYTDWVNLGRPLCWCESRQCHGNADNVGQGKNNNIWVLNWDLDVLLAAWNKTDPISTNTVVTGGGKTVLWVCADFDHKPQGKNNNIRVLTGDLDVMLYYWNNVRIPDANCPAP